MILCDAELREAIASGALVIDGMAADAIQPASIDLRLGDAFHRPAAEAIAAVDNIDGKWRARLHDGTTSVVPYVGTTIDRWEGENRGGYVLHPGDFVLAHTHERIIIPDDAVARVEGKSSVGRVGLLVHVTAGYIDPGFAGTITLEVVNVSRSTVILRPGIFIAQLSVIRMARRAARPYGADGLGSKYQNQASPTGVR